MAFLWKKVIEKCHWDVRVQGQMAQAWVSSDRFISSVEMSCCLSSKLDNAVPSATVFLDTADCKYQLRGQLQVLCGWRSESFGNSDLPSQLWLLPLTLDSETSLISSTPLSWRRDGTIFPWEQCTSETGDLSLTLSTSYIGGKIIW